MFEFSENYVLYEATAIITRPYTELFSPKDKLIVELTTKEVYHGEFIGGGKNRIDLINAGHLQLSKNNGRTYSFYRNEIDRIKLFKSHEDKIDVEECTNIKLDKDEYYRLKEMTKNYVYLEDACLSSPLYSSAIKRLSRADQIGVATPGILNRQLPIPLLILSTWQDVFIFDTSKLPHNYFYPKIKEIFESNNICKIIHRGGQLFNVLSTHYNVVPKNIFDTEIVDVIIQKMKNTNHRIEQFRNISECLQFYLNFPGTLNDACQVKAEKWSKRPLKDSKKVYASQLGTYLVLLKETMTEILLSDFNQTVDNFCDYYDNIVNDYEFSEKFKLKKLSPELQTLIADASSLSLE